MTQALKRKVINMKKTFFIVTSSYNDKGKIVANITGTIEAEERPKTQFATVHGKDIYNDFFDSREEAEKFVDDSKKA